MRMKLGLGLVMAVLVLGCVSCATGPRGGVAPSLTAAGAQGEFAGWRSYSEQAGTATAAVWQMETNGVLICRGAPKGYLYTEKDYTNFKIEFEYRFPPGATQSHGGVLVRLTGEHSIWPRSLEFQLNQGQAGDFWGLRGFVYTGPEDRFRVLTNTPYGTLRHLRRFRAMEKPAGQWNRFEGLVYGDMAVQKINGVTVNRAVGCDVVAGKIALTAEGEEIHFRNVRITPLP
ncbi:MAG: DUF1080 domain-containing protein [Verrucomicrobiae bacterium]|nr:DUF1080 domain-containing protein [Verrucomicrobiae bacterium]